MWCLLNLYLLLLPDRSALWAFARAHPYFTAVLVLYVVMLLIAWRIRAARARRGRYSRSAYTRSLHNVRSDAQARTREASNEYLRQVRDTTRR